MNYFLKLLTLAIVFGLFATCQNLGRRNTESALKDGPSGAHSFHVVQSFPYPNPGELSICSYNISFLGFFLDKRNVELSRILRPCDLVVIQELVAPPWPITALNGDAIEGDGEAADFFAAMEDVGFDRHLLSPNDTGPNTINSNTSQTEYFVAFYRSNKLKPASHLPYGYLTLKSSGGIPVLSKNPVYSRVPYAFSFATVDDKFDFVIISVHLQPDMSGVSRKMTAAMRVNEYRAILKWIQSKMQTVGERDFIIAGDANIVTKNEMNCFMGKSCTYYNEQLAELDDELSGEIDYNHQSISQGFIRDYTSLNDKRNGTNLRWNNPSKRKPFDHVFYHTSYSSEIIPDLYMIDTAKKFDLEGEWNDTISDFITAYSDHNPIQFFVKLTSDDD